MIRRPITSFHIEQFGCRATQADGAAIERQLREQGCHIAEGPNSADVVVVNTCTVTSSADMQARDAIRKIHAANPSARIIVTGCYAQRAPEELAVLPGVSFVVGNSHKPQIPDLVQAISARTRPGDSPLLPVLPEKFAHPTRVPDSRSHSSGDAMRYPSASILTGDIFRVSDVLVAPVLGGEGNHTRPTLKIQDGCNSRCSFCVIPFVRGKSRSLPPGQVISEIQRLTDSGFREIVLSGINLGTYGRDLSPRVEFLDLLRRILEATSAERLRISSIEPLDVTQDLIALFASTDRIAQHFHMPLQSGSDRVLAAMHRWYRTEHYARRVELIHEWIPNAAIGADVIAGFPGEIEDDHQATLHFIEARPFAYLHVFSYSSRPGTKASIFANPVSGHIVKRRARELRALAASKSAAFRRSQTGRTLRVLTLRSFGNSVSHEACTPALSSNYLSVQIPAKLPPNQFVQVVLSDGGTQAVPVWPDSVHVAASHSGRHGTMTAEQEPFAGHSKL